MHWTRRERLVCVPKITGASPLMRIVTLACPFTMEHLRAGLGDSLESHVKKFGKISEVSTYRPDLYPTAYIFKSPGVTVSVTPLPKEVANIEVFFESVPSESVEKLLEAYSGLGGWNPYPLSDLNFKPQFPSFSTTNIFGVTLFTWSVAMASPDHTTSGNAWDRFCCLKPPLLY